MFRAHLLIPPLALSCAAVACERARPSSSRSAPAAAHTASVRIVGRTDGAPHPRFEWSGVSIEARFRGTSVVADLDAGEDAHFGVVVDGTLRSRIGGSAGRKRYTLASGLPDGVHDVALVRLTEPNEEGPSTFFGLEAPDGILLEAPRRAHTMEVIGDSISCGYGDEDTDPCKFRYTTENGYAAYGSVAARALGADLHTECWSGKGVVRNYDGTTKELLPELFQRTLPSDPSSRWDFAFVPEAVVVNLGTNDFQLGDPGHVFVDEYARFAASLRSRYPHAFVFLVIAPMLTGDALERARAYLDEVVRVRRAAGDSRVVQIRIAPQDPRNGIGCYAHPSVETHAEMGAALASAMRGALGW